ERSRALIAGHWFAYVNMGRIASVRRWLGEVGEEAVAADPELALIAAWVATLSGDREGYARWLPLAWGERAGPVAGGFASLVSGVALARAFGCEGLVAGAAGAGRAVELETDPASPWCATARLLLGMRLCLGGDAPAARDCFQDAARLSKARAPMVRAAALAQL